MVCDSPFKLKPITRYQSTSPYLQAAIMYFVYAFMYAYTHEM